MNIKKKNFLKSLKVRQTVLKIKECKCPLCTEKVNKKEFRNDVFVREFERSGLCQECQDTVFGYKIAW